MRGRWVAGRRLVVNIIGLKLSTSFETHLWKCIYDRHTHRQISQKRSIFRWGNVFLLCVEWAADHFGLDRQTDGMHAAFCSHRRHRPGALQVGSTGITFATWDRSTVPDKPSHVSVGGHWTPGPRSAAQQKLIVPRCRRKTFGCRAFSVVSPSVWNALGLPDSLRDPGLTLFIFRRHLKTYFFTLY